MPSADIIGLFQSLGIAAPLVALLWYLLQSTNGERREITDKFLTTLENSIVTNAQQYMAQSNALIAAMDTLTRTTIEKQAREVEDHKIMVETLQKLATRLERAP